MSQQRRKRSSTAATAEEPEADSVDGSPPAPEQVRARKQRHPWVYRDGRWVMTGENNG